MRKITKIHIHHTQCPTSWYNYNPDYWIEEITRWHLERKFWTIGYHHVVFPDGEIRPGRPEDKKPASIKWHNTGALAICAFGNFDNEMVNQDQYESWTDFTAKKINQFNLNAEKDIIFHREFNKNKNCPGKSIIKSRFIRDVQEKLLINQV